MKEPGARLEKCLDGQRPLNSADNQVSSITKQSVVLSAILIMRQPTSQILLFAIMLI